MHDIRTVSQTSSLPREPDGGSRTSSKRSFEKIAVVAFVVINLLGPFLIGERYPFTIAPMFCDEPSQFAEYELYDAEGNRLSLAEFQLQRNYDGNPPGLGVGIQPPSTFDTFGEVPTREELHAHVQAMLQKHPELDSVRVICRVIGAVDDQHVGELPGRTMDFVVHHRGARS